MTEAKTQRLKDSIALLEWLKEDQSLDSIISITIKKSEDFSTYSRRSTISINTIDILPKGSNYHCVIEIEADKNPFSLNLFEHSIKQEIINLNIKATVHSFITEKKLKLCFTLNELTQTEASVNLSITKYHKDILSDAINQVQNIKSQYQRDHLQLWL